MEQREVIRKIREYHIIKSIIGSDSVKRLIEKKDPKISGVLAVYSGYIEFFGAMRIDNIEDFDRFFRRLERNYLADDKHRKVQPTEAGYSDYITAVLGKKGLETATKVFNEEDNFRAMKEMHIDIGKRTQETNAVIVANYIGEYAVVSGLRGNVTEAQRKNRDLEAQLDKTRLVLKLTKENASTADAVLAKVDEFQDTILDQIIVHSAGSDYLMKAIAKSTGRKINEVEDLIMILARESKVRDKEILETLARIEAAAGKTTVVADLSGTEYLMRSIAKSTGRKIEGVETAVYNASAASRARDERIEGKIDTISARMDKDAKWKYGATAIGSVAGGAAVTALLFLLLGRGQTAAPVTTVEGIDPQAFASYSQDVGTLHSSLKDMIVSDNRFDSTEKDAYIASVEEFVAKYASGDFAESSKQESDHLTYIANAVYGMSEDKLALAARIIGLESQIVELQTEVETLKKGNPDFEAEKAALNAKIADLEAQVADLTAQLDASEDAKTIQALNVKIEGLEKQVADLTAQVETLTGENTTLKTENEQLKTQVADLNAQNTKLTSDLATANSALSTAEAKVAQLEADKAKLEKDLEDGKITIEEYKKKNDELTKKNSDLAKQVEDLVAQVADLNTQLQAAQEKAAKLEAEIKTLGDSNAKLTSDLAAANATIKTLEDQVNGLTAEAAELIFDIAEIITGEPQADLEQAMAIVMDDLGITPTTPSQGNTKPTGPEPN